jgi:hypothetical protein
MINPKSIYGVCPNCRSITNHNLAGGDLYRCWCCGSVTGRDEIQVRWKNRRLDLAQGGLFE